MVGVHRQTRGMVRSRGANDENEPPENCEVLQVSTSRASSSSSCQLACPIQTIQKNIVRRSQWSRRAPNRNRRSSGEGCVWAPWSTGRTWSTGQWSTESTATVEAQVGGGPLSSNQQGSSGAVVDFQAPSLGSLWAAAGQLRNQSVSYYCRSS